LLEEFIVVNQSLQVFSIKLGEDGIDKPTSFLTSFRDNPYVIRRNEDAGKPAYMLCKFFIWIAIEQELLFSCIPQNADHIKKMVVPGKVALDPEACRASLDIYHVGPAEIAFCEAQVINGIEQVCLAHAIGSADTHDTGMELEGTMRVIFKLYQRYGIEL
jgi:hypothetical protein